MALCTQFPCVQHSSPGCVLYQCCGDMTFPWLLPIALLGTHPPLEEPRAALELTAVSHGCAELSLTPGPSDVLLPLFARSCPTCTEVSVWVCILLSDFLYLPRLQLSL